MKKESEGFNLSIFKNQPAAKAAAVAGVDLELIAFNLNLSPEERLRQHEESLQFVQELQKSKRAK